MALRFTITQINVPTKPGASKIFIDGISVELIFRGSARYLINGEQLDATADRAPVIMYFPPIFDATGKAMPYDQELYLEIPQGQLNAQITVKQIYQDPAR